MKIYPFTIYKSRLGDPKKLWVRYDPTGEGGEFSKRGVLKAVRENKLYEYYVKHF